MVTLCLGWMPAVHPFALEQRGPAALRAARAAVEAVLDLPLRTEVVGRGDGGDGASGPASRHAVVMARAPALEGGAEVGSKRTRGGDGDGDGDGGVEGREEASDGEALAEGGSRKRAKAATKALPPPARAKEGKGKAREPTKRARRGRGKAGR